MSSAAVVVDLKDYEVFNVVAQKPSLKALKNAEKLDLKKIINNVKNEAKEKKVKFINTQVIITKIEEKREKLLDELEHFDFFTSMCLAEKLKVENLQILVDYIKYLVNNSFLFKSDLYTYEQEKEDFKRYDKEMFVTKVQVFMDINNLYVKDVIEKKGELQLIKKYIIDAKKLFNYLKINAYNVKVINISINPFAAQTHFYIDKDTKEAVLVKNKIMLKEPNYGILGQVGEKEKEQILKDYKSLWDGGEKLFDVLDFIIFGRFLSARKELQLNINAPSSWGKGFFMGALEDIGAGFTIKQSDFKGDRPSGLNVDSLQNSLCLLIDEFKKYNNYLFEINNYMYIEEKFGSRYKVAVYARLFFNAQKSESLTGYINEQITNRISLLEIKTDKLLINSQIYNKNKLIYKEVIKEFFYNYFTEKIDYLVGLGQVKAEEVADKQVQQIIAKYKIKAKSTDELIIDTLVEFLEDYKQYLGHKENNEQDIIYKKYTKKEVELFESYIFYNENLQKFFILKYEDTILNILKERLQERDYKKVEYSRAELLDILQKYLNADYKVAHITQLKAKKRAVVIKEQNIYRYEDNNRNELINSNNIDTKCEESNNLYDEIDLINANYAYSSSLLIDDLKNDKNKFLLITTLNQILLNINNLKNFYDGDDIKILLANYIKDKANLLKVLNLYKNKDYFKKQQQANSPF